MLILLLKSVLFSLLILTPIIAQPLRLGLIVIIIAIVLRVIVGFLFVSWFGFLLFLIYVGGLLVIFAYVVVLMPNNYFFSKNVFFYFLMSFIIIRLLLSLVYVNINNRERLFLMQDSAQILVSDYSGVVFVFLAIILFFALLVVVKVCYFQGGPLRPFRM